MVQRYVAPIFRLLLAILILMVPLLLAALAQADPASPSTLVALRSVTLGKETRGGGVAGHLSGSAPAVLIDRQGSRFLVETKNVSGTTRGWAEASAFLLLDDPAETIDSLLSRARLTANQGDRKVLTIALLTEVVRRDPARVDAWSLLGTSAESLAASLRPAADGHRPVSLDLAASWGVKMVESPKGKGYRYDGEAWRRVIALGTEGDVAEEARLHLLLKCGAVVDPKSPEDLAAVATRERDLGEFLASFPTSKNRLPFLLERSRLLALLSESAAKKGDWDVSQKRREAAIEAASEVSSTAPDAARRRAADRLVVRLTKSFPRRPGSSSPVVAANGTRAHFTVDAAGAALHVERADGKDLIQPFAVTSPDTASLAFDPTGTRLVWDESPLPGRRRTRLLDLGRARVFEPASSAEPELLGATDAAARAADRYTTFLGFSPDGRQLLVVTEGFTEGGVRIPRRHVVCDVDGGRPPQFVDRPFSAPGVIDWERIKARPSVMEPEPETATERRSG